MSKSTPKTFVFNDGSKNSYGFMIPTSGIRLDRFKKNPIMLDSHYNSNQSVLGKWTGLKNENGVLSGKPLFDMDDEQAAKIAGKVERDFISSCSMGVTFHPDDLRYVDGNLVLEKCELYEVSIVAVPSNENSIRLYSPEGELMNESEVQKLCLSAIPVNDEKVINENQNKDMKKITLTAAIFVLLGFGEGTTEVEPKELEAKIKALHAEKEAAELKLSAKLEAEETAKLAAITEKVENGIKAGALSADKKDQYIQLGVANEALLDDVVANAPKKQSFAAQVKGKKGSDELNVETPEDFQKLDTEAQLAFKQSQPEAYMKLFKK